MHAPRAPWRERDVLLVLGGGIANDVGDWMLEVALPVYVFVETGSGVATAAVYLIDLLVGLALGPLGGSLVDRWPLRRTLVGTNVLQAMALLPLLAVDGGTIWPIYLVAALQGALQQVNDPATFTLLPRLVRRDQLIRVNAAASTGGALARLIGAPLGGVAVATGGIEAVLVADAATFLVVALASSRLSARADVVGDDAAEAEAGTAIEAGVRAGLREVRRRPPVAALVAVQALARLAFAAFPVLFIAFVAEHLDGGGTEVGIIRGSAALGGIVAGVAIGRVADRHDPAAVMVVGYLLFAVLGLGFVNAPSFTSTLWVYAVLFGLTGLPNVTAMVGTRSTGQLLCPPQILGRLAGLMSATSAVGAAIGAIGAGLLIEVFPVRAVFNAQAAVFAVCGALGWAFVLRPVRRGAVTATG